MASELKIKQIYQNDIFTGFCSSRSTGGWIIVVGVVGTKLQKLFLSSCRNSISSRSRMNLDSLKLDSLKLEAAEAG